MIIFVFFVKDKYLNIKNLRNDEEINSEVVNLQFMCHQLPYIQEILQKGMKAILSDGSIWLLPDESKDLFGFRKGNFKNWHVGDLVIISPLNCVARDTSTHQLINLNKLKEASKEESDLSVMLVH